MLNNRQIMVNAMAVALEAMQSEVGSQEDCGDLKPILSDIHAELNAWLDDADDAHMTKASILISNAQVMMDSIREKRLR